MHLLFLFFTSSIRGLSSICGFHFVSGVIGYHILPDLLMEQTLPRYYTHHLSYYLQGNELHSGFIPPYQILELENLSYQVTIFNDL
ncbi:hypothetical protein P3L10_010931 [Capsicum annuum]